MFTLRHHERSLVVDKPLVMGILNVTPDSFYTVSRVTTDDILGKAAQMIKDGAVILDIGGQSTRPGSLAISPEEEASRILEPIRLIHDQYPKIFISVDTYYASVARQAVEAGAFMVNDISAGSLDSDMLPTVASLQVPYVIMHMRGNPATMQQLTDYTDLVAKVRDFLLQKIDVCKSVGIQDLIVDPGFGFAKTVEQNFELLRNLEHFTNLNAPLLLGISRKSFIYKTLHTTAEGALNGSTFLHAVGLQKGASILRVHDVKEAAEAVKLFTALH